MKDVIVIGAGPAGLAAAVQAQLAGLDVLMISEEEISAKVERAREIENYLGWPHTTGAELAAAFRRHRAHLGIGLKQEQVTGIYKMKAHFVVQTEDESFDARTVVVAAGVRKPKMLAGTQEGLGRYVSTCASCDGHLVRERETHVVLYDSAQWSDILYLAGLASRLNLYTTLTPPEPLPAHVLLCPTYPSAVGSDESGPYLVLNATRIPIREVFVLQKAIAPEALIPGLAWRNGHIQVDRKMHTSFEGLYAAGDITGGPYQYLKAAGEGLVAGHEAVKWVRAKR